ncbi:dTDP-glucose 4,6-dehydratase [Candidatus Parcubacteria bacterium]|nr:dTDP-glucose 4,6-dehydratase [Candidatus Parcubacteria bacterium]
MTILVTGGAGFIGSHFVRLVLTEHPEDRVINIDKLTYAGNLDNLRDVEKMVEAEGPLANPARSPISGQSSRRYSFVQGDIADQALVERILAKEGVEAIVNFAAETHVDRSIAEAAQFVEANVLGVLVLLNAARTAGVKRFLQVSTDEVYGSISEGYCTETAALNPTNPYSACKAGAEHLCRSYAHTYDMDVIITRGSNSFGPFQYPEKFIPRVATRLIIDQPAPIYGYGLNVRTWLDVRDHVMGIDRVLREGVKGETYNIGGAIEKPNIEVALQIAYLLGKPPTAIEFVADRPGHDFRYGLDSSKIGRELGWAPERSFEDSIRETVLWYTENRWWWQKILGEGKVEFL